MELTLQRNDGQRKANAIVYTAEGYRGSVRVSKTLFADKQGPATVVVSSDAIATPKSKETAEQRKARLAAMPKLTPEQKLANLEKKLAKLREKVASGKAA